MEDKLEFNNRFQLLDGEDDVLLIDNDAFTVARLKDLLRRQFDPGLFKYQDKLTFSGVAFYLDEFKWHAKLKNCQFLKIGSKGWKKGKVRSLVSLFPDDTIKVSLEFSSEEPPQPESPLDDLRELPEYKQQL